MAAGLSPIFGLVSAPGWSLEQLLGRAAGERPQAVVPAGVWQAARPMGGWVLVGCTVAPGFDFSGFEMAPPEWSPGP